MSEDERSKPTNGRHFVVLVYSAEVECKSSLHASLIQSLNHTGTYPGRHKCHWCNHCYLLHQDRKSDGKCAIGFHCSPGDSPHRIHMSLDWCKPHVRIQRCSVVRTHDYRFRSFWSHWHRCMFGLSKCHWCSCNFVHRCHYSVMDHQYTFHLLLHKCHPSSFRILRNLILIENKKNS